MTKADIKQIELENVSLRNGLTDLQKDRDAWQSEYRAARAEVERVKIERDTLKREKQDFERKSENFKKLLAEQGTRSRNRLMSVYFLLNTIRKMGTHHEKAVAVSFLMQTVDDLVQGKDGLSWDQDLMQDLPF